MSIIRTVAQPLTYHTDTLFDKGNKDFLIQADIIAEGRVITISAKNIGIDQHVTITAKALIIRCQETFSSLGFLNAPKIAITAQEAYLSGTIAEEADVDLVSDNEPCRDEALAAQAFNRIAGQFKTPR